MATSIFSRKRDLAYLIYFCTGILATFLVDMQSLYPPHFVPSLMASLKAYYIATYNDLFFISPPPFFKLYMWLELLYQAPVMFWAIPNLYRDSPKVPLVLLPFAVMVFLTTLTCMVEYAFWDVPQKQKIDMTTLYGPYLALSAYMAVDMYLRLGEMIKKVTTATSTAGAKKSQ